MPLQEPNAIFRQLDDIRGAETFQSVENIPVFMTCLSQRLLDCRNVYGRRRCRAVLLEFGQNVLEYWHIIPRQL